MSRAVGGDIIERVDVVLDRHRYAVQRAQVQALGEQLVGLARLGQRHGRIDMNEGVQGRIQALDAVQGCLGQLDARQAARAQALGERDDRLTKKRSNVSRFRQAHTNNSIKLLRIKGKGWIADCRDAPSALRSCPVQWLPPLPRTSTNSHSARSGSRSALAR
ncbi:hypothetical protein D3C73_1128210 [compost metagenome]